MPLYIYAHILKLKSLEIQSYCGPKLGVMPFTPVTCQACVVKTTLFRNEAIMRFMLTTHALYHAQGCRKRPKIRGSGMISVHAWGSIMICDSSSVPVTWMRLRNRL